MEMVFCDKGKNEYGDQLWSVNFVDKYNNFVGVDNIQYCELSIIKDSKEIIEEHTLEWVACTDEKKLKDKEHAEQYSEIEKILKNCVLVEQMRSIRDDGVLLSQYYTIKLQNETTGETLYLVLSMQDGYNYYGDISNVSINLKGKQRECEFNEQLSTFKNKEWNKLNKFDLINCIEI